MPKRFFRRLYLMSNGKVLWRGCDRRCRRPAAPRARVEAGLQLLVLLAKPDAVELARIGRLVRRQSPTIRQHAPSRLSRNFDRDSLSPKTVSMRPTRRSRVASPGLP